MRSQALTVEVAEFSARLSACLEGNEVFLIDGNRQRVLQYRTSIDEQITVVEHCAGEAFRRARRFLIDAKLKRARGADDANALHFCRQAHASARELLGDVQRLVAQRDEILARRAARTAAPLAAE